MFQMLLRLKSQQFHVELRQLTLVDSREMASGTYSELLCPMMRTGSAAQLYHIDSTGTKPVYEDEIQDGLLRLNGYFYQLYFQAYGGGRGPDNAQRKLDQNCGLNRQAQR